MTSKQQLTGDFRASAKSAMAFMAPAVHVKLTLDAAKEGKSLAYLVAETLAKRAGRRLDGSRLRGGK